MTVPGKKNVIDSRGSTCDNRYYFPHNSIGRVNLDVLILWVG